MNDFPVLLYLHGFLSSPNSQKAQLAAAYYRELNADNRLLIPQLSGSPGENVTLLQDMIADARGASIIVMGSSLGGYYATFLAEEHGLPAVLINPAVRPYDSWETHLGEHRNYYTDEVHVVTREHIDELLRLEKTSLQWPGNFRVYLQTGDEVLDYNLAVEKYQPANCVVRENGSHSYDNFASELPGMFDFLLSRNQHFAR